LTNNENNTHIAVQLSRHEWRILIGFIRNQERHLDQSLAAGKLEHRLLPGLPNTSLLDELRQIHAKLTLGLATAEQEVP
jgi:hypothetical protein